MDYVSDIAPGSREVLNREDQNWIRNVCCIGQRAATCRYLTCGPGGWDCVKQDPKLGPYLDARVFAEQMNARGDNCPGLSKTPPQPVPEPPEFAA